MLDPFTPAELEAAAEALRRHVGVALPYPTANVALRAVLPDHDARVRAEEREGIAQALLAHNQRLPKDWIGGSDGARRAAAIARAHRTTEEPDHADR